MPALTRRTVRALVTAALALTAVAAGSVAAASTASAEPPSVLVDEVTDHAGVLSPADATAVAAALDGLADRTRYQLFVVYVGSFDGMPGAQWADETAVRSGLGRDDILLAVAVDDRQYRVSVDRDSPLSDAALETVEADRIEPALRDGDWAGAATAAAAGYEEAEVAGRTPWLVVGVVSAGIALLVLLPAVGLPLLRRRRLRRRRPRASPRACG